MKLTVDFSRIKDRDSFHSEFHAAMGFPEFYGRNMDAWIDCMSCIDDPDAGMTAVTVQPGESLDLVLVGTEAGLSACPEVFAEFLECVALVNRRFIESGSATRLQTIAT